ncbi:MAG: AAA family ATPase [Chloroflexi bacterium]|nr:AAA family ATPase [Chloroflexota bacterium]
MMAEQIPPVNPYRPDADDSELKLVPFAGRQKAFERLYQRLTDPIRAEATILLGQQGVGKTALLRHFHTFFDETFVSVCVPLRQMPLTDEDAWLKALAQRITSALVMRNFTLARLPQEAPDGSAARAWFEESYLLEVFNIIRRHRRLALLLDDADLLLRAADEGRLPADSFDYLYRLLTDYRQLGIVLTLDARFESEVVRLSPLAMVTGVFRLTNLTPDESAWLLREPVRAFYSLSDEAVAAIYRATGGQPRLLQRFGDALFRHWAAQPEQTALGTEQAKTLLPQVYAASEHEFRQMWMEMNQTERLVLTAVAGRLFEDPLAPINAAAIAAWLVETDYPLDMTAINAAIRSLEYREVFTGSPLQIGAGLLQTWLLDNARLSPPANNASAARPTSDAQRLNRRVAALAIVALAALILALMIALAGTNTPESGLAPPTVTLAVTNTP